jgi:hypothetical protein
MVPCSDQVNITVLLELAATVATHDMISLAI